MKAPAIRFYQTGSFAVGNRLLDPEQRSVQAGEQRTNSITCGHRACQGCGEALGARYALDAAMRATNGQMIAANATGLPRGLLHPLPGDVVADPLDPLAVRERARRLDRHRRGAAGEGPRGRARRRPGRRRRHRGHRHGVPVGDVRAGRRRALHLLRQRGVHEHRRAALGRHAAGGAHGHHAGGRPRARERVRPGQERAADRDGARDPLRRDRHRRRAARPRGEGPDRDGDPRRALPACLRPLPAGLGERLQGHDPDRAAREGVGHLPRVRGARRRGERRLEDPPAGTRRGVPAPAEALRAPVQARAADRCHRPHPGRRRPQHPPLRPARRRRERHADGQALRDHAGRRLEPREQDRLLARGAPAVRPPPAAVQPRAVRPARTSSSGSTTPSPATTRPPGASSSRTTRCPP